MIHAVTPDGLAGARARLDPVAASWLDDCGFVAAAGEVVLLPGATGGTQAWVGAGPVGDPYCFAALADRLPAGSLWRLAPELVGRQRDDAVLGFCLGAYRFEHFRPAKRAPARLLRPAGIDAGVESIAQAVWLARDLINLPANELGPAELAAAVVALAEADGATATIIEGAALAAAYPTIAAVGAGAGRPPVVAGLDWHCPGAPADAPLIALCGKGVVFDTGGNDIKPAGAMLRMKKDMAGAAILLGVAHVVMRLRLPVRLVLRVGCVENSVSGSAMRPLDVVRTRSGRSVEIGNTDAEGRLVLCDLLDEVCARDPALVIDAATLTGAARVALGPDLPALFCNDEDWSARLLAAGGAVADPLWRMPLWQQYDSWLDSPVADMNNVSSKPFGGAIVAALFLNRFVPAGIAWAHLDVFGWNEATRPGRPEGGEAQALRCVAAALATRFGPA